MREPTHSAGTHTEILVQGRRLHLCSYGRLGNPPLVLVHGGCAHLHWWDVFAEAMAADFHVVTFDLRGHGDSEPTLPAAYTLTDYGDDLTAVVAELGISAMHLVGHSLGALIAGRFAITFPERVRELTLVDSNAQLSEANVRYLRRLRHFPHPAYKTFEEAVQRFRLLPTATSASPACLRRIASHSVVQRDDGRWTLKFDRDTLVQLEPIDLVPDLRRSNLRPCFVRGEHSPVLPQARLHQLLHDLPEARTFTVPNSHHHVMLDNPTGFEAALRSDWKSRRY